MADRVTFSIVAPIYNELNSILLLHERIGRVMDGLGESWELILVDDGSTDGSTEAILDLAARDVRVVPIVFARNFGHQVAVTAGLDLLPADLPHHRCEDPPRHRRLPAARPSGGRGDGSDARTASLPARHGRLGRLPG